MLRNRGGTPQLVMVEEPETKIRFRYKSEGGSHGGLVGKRKVEGNKIYPTVKLQNYHGKKRVFIRVTLFTEDEKEHVLEFKGKKNEDGLHHIDEYLQDNKTATFTNLKIMAKKRDEIEKILMDRKIQNLRLGVAEGMRNHLKTRYSKEVKERAKEILNSVKLCFEAFEEGTTNPMCKLFSEVICNQKAASKGDLRIHRMSQVAGSYKGGDEIILLCDKVQKENIKIKFYEKDDCGNVIWEKYAVFSTADVHYQVAITFKTPPFKTNATKIVFICLERSEEESNTIEFTYKAEENPAKKRKYMPEHCLNIPSPVESTSTESSMSMSSPDSYNNEIPMCTTYPESPANGKNSSEIDAIMQEIPPCIDLCQYLDISDSEFEEMKKAYSFENGDRFEMDENVNSLAMYDNQEDYRLPFDFNLKESDSSLYASIAPVSYTGDKIQMDYNEQSAMFENLTIKKHANSEVQLNSSNIDGKVYDHDVLQGEMYIGTDSFPKFMEKFGSVSLKSNDINLSHKKLHQESKTCYQNDLQEKKKRWSSRLLKRDYAGNTLLHLMVQKSTEGRIILPILEMNRLLNSGIINIQNNKKETALHLAVEEKKIKLVKILLKYGANPNIKNSDGNNCYHIAALKNTLDVMVSLLDVKILPDINAFNYEGLTPLHIAIMESSVIQLELLKFPATNVNVKERKSGRYPLHFAVQFPGSFIEALLKKENIDINVQDFDGNTPLHIACATENAEAVKKLLEAGADPSLKNFKENLNDLNVKCSEDISDGQTPADMTSNIAILQLLKNAVEPFTEDQISKQCFDSVPGPSEKSNPTMEKLCSYLNESEQWKLISIYFIDEQFTCNLEYSENPAKKLLNFIQNKEKEDYIVKLKEALKLADLSDAVKIIQEGKLDCI